MFKSWRNLNSISLRDGQWTVSIKWMKTGQCGALAAKWRNYLREDGVSPAAKAAHRLSKIRDEEWKLVVESNSLSLWSVTSVFCGDVKRTEQKSQFHMG